jgi:Phage stabilisation protein
MKVPLIGSAYQVRSLIASAQRCVNLYSERNPEDAPFPFTYYLTPGISTVATASSLGWRGLYVSTLGILYGVCGNTLYSISSAFALTTIGAISKGASPVSMVDNGLQLLIVDGSASGWKLDLITGGFIQITDAAFYGGNRVDLVDGFFVLNRPGTNQFYISGFLAATFDPLNFVAKTGFSDKVVATAVAKRQIFVFGEQTTEVWYNVGGATFPFARMPGAFIQFGCAAAATVAQSDGSIYWLSKSPQGDCLVLRSENYDRARISTFAIEKAFQSYSRVDDATGYLYQQDGHTFYVLNFPAANKTWAFDVATSEWHERMFMDASGLENRQRQACYAFFNGQCIVGDWQNGKLYVMDTAVFQDDGAAIRRIRSFPHLLSDGDRVMYKTLIADMEVGQGLPASLADPEVRLRWSDTRGASWGAYVTNNLGATGDFLQSIQYQRLGMARDRVFELSWAANARTALSGAFIDAIPAGS